MRVLRMAIVLVALSLAGALPALRAAEGEAGETRELLYRILNFAILAGGLGYLIKKHGGAFFAARGEAILRGISEAQKLHEESEARARAVEERLAGLGAQIEELRAKAKAEMAAEQARREREAEQAVRKVFTQAEQEMAALVKTARLELKAHAASLAIELAEKKIAGRITPQTQRSLVGSFIESLRA